MTAQSKPTSADVPREHTVVGAQLRGVVRCLCGETGPGIGSRAWLAQHQADMLAAAGYPTTPEALAEHDAQVLRAFQCYIDKRYDQIGEHAPSPVGYWEGYLDALDATSTEAGARADRITAGEQP